MTPVTLAGLWCTNMYRDVTCHRDRRGGWQVVGGWVCCVYWDRLLYQNGAVCVIITLAAKLRVMVMFLIYTWQQNYYEHYRRKGETGRDSLSRRTRSLDRLHYNRNVVVKSNQRSNRRICCRRAAATIYIIVFVHLIWWLSASSGGIFLLGLRVLCSSWFVRLAESSRRYGFDRDGRMEFLVVSINVHLSEVI